MIKDADKGEFKEKFPGEKEFKGALEYAIVKAKPEENNVPGVILLKPRNSNLRKDIENIIFEFDGKNVNFAVSKKEEQYLDSIGRYKDCIAIMIEKNGKDADIIKDNIIEKLSSVIGDIKFEIATTACYSNKTDTAKKILEKAYQGKK